MSINIRNLWEQNEGLAREDRKAGLKRISISFINIIEWIFTTQKLKIALALDRINQKSAIL